MTTFKIFQISKNILKADNLNCKNILVLVLLNSKSFNVIIWILDIVYLNKKSFKSLKYESIFQSLNDQLGEYF